MPLPPLVEPIERLQPDESVRTARHAALAGFGDVAQRRLAAAHVAVVGAGGIGAPVVLALSAAGVGRLTVIDDDVVEASNLQRQVIHRRTDIGRPKADSATRVAQELSSTDVRTHVERLDAGNATRLLAGADVIIDGTDTFATREVVATASESLGIPLVWGVVQEFHAQATVFWSRPPSGTDSVRLRDLYPPETVGDVPSCAQVGVLGALCLQVGAVLATEAIKLITGTGEPLLGRVMLIDALRARTTEVPLRAAAIAAPGEEVRDATNVPAGSAPASVPHLSPADFDAARAAGAIAIDVRDPRETATGVIPDSHLVPLQALLSDPTAVRPSGPVVVVCQVGLRAERAARALIAHGIDAAVLTGGIDAWRAAARETVPA